MSKRIKRLNERYQQISIRWKLEQRSRDEKFDQQVPVRETQCRKAS